MIEVIKCRCCGSFDLFTYFSLGHQPLANTFRWSKDSNSPKFPLSLNLCKYCWHSQLSVAVDPEFLFRDYSYVSGTSNTLNQYFSWFVEFTEKCAVAPGAVKGSVLEIGCNDGTQLDKFRQNGWDVVGVDPAKNLLAFSKQKGLDVISEFWSSSVAAKLNQKFDVIIAQNVFAHVHDVDDFLFATQMCLKSGAPLLIQTSQANMVIDGQFDTVYHEHLSYFNARSMCALAKRNGWRVDFIRMVSIHGGSYIFGLSKGGVDGDSTAFRIQLEKTIGVYDNNAYNTFSAKAYETINSLDNFITHQSKVCNKRVVGYGAAAKGVAILNAIQAKLDVVVDENPLKQGKFIPGTNTLVVPPSEMDTWLPEETVYVILAWNFVDEICEKIGVYTKGRSMAYTYLPQSKTMVC